MATGLALAVGTLGACALTLAPDAAAPAGPAAVAADAGAVESSSARIQPRRDWRFDSDGVTFSNRLESARLNGVERLAPGHYALTIAPEITPINPSPWYGFTVVAGTAQPLVLEFRYRHGKARYRPKLSRDGHHWTAAGDDQYSEDDQGGATLTVTAGPQPLHVFAQPPIGPADFEAWSGRLVDSGVARRSVIGRSEQGRPLHMLAIGNPDAHDVLLVLGRQHPPEVTGAQAMMGFVDQLAGGSPLARRFRERVLVLVMPLMNPDGVVEGNWRGNINGQDLNRDWGPFTQAETRAVRDMLQRELGQAGRELVFTIDFHSTWSDVFYTVEEDPARAPGGVLRRWIDGMQQRYPGRIRESARPAETAVFKNWAFNRYGVPAVTYEVGDRTGKAELGELADFAADSLMRILLAPRPLAPSLPDPREPVEG